MIECEECAAELDNTIPQDIMKGEIVLCVCGAEYEVDSINPIKLKKAEPIGEDFGE